MENLIEIAVHEPTLIQALVLTLLGMFVYQLMAVSASHRVKAIADLHFAKWLHDNSLNLIISMTLAGILFYARWITGTLTTELCVMMGFAAEALARKMQKLITK